MVAAKNRRNAALNPYAHLQWPNCQPEDIAKTEVIAWPFRYGHVCPASDGASFTGVTVTPIATPLTVMAGEAPSPVSVTLYVKLAGPL